VEGKRKPLDYKQFARDAASGKFTQSKLAEKYDYSLSMIKKIVAGQRRPEAQELIEKLLRQLAGLERAALPHRGHQLVLLRL